MNCEYCENIEVCNVPKLLKRAVTIAKDVGMIKNDFTMNEKLEELFSKECLFYQKVEKS